MTLLVVALLATVPTIHYQTPMLGAIGVEFGADTAAVGWVPTLTFAGFLIGTVLLVPLGDRIDKRRLILMKLMGLIASMLAMAAAPSLAMLAAAGFVAGVCASLSQHMVSLVAELAPAQERGRAVGTVLSGLFVGVLFGRVAGGLVASQWGWRWMYVFSALAMLALAPALLKRLPRTAPSTRLRYSALIRSLGRMLTEHADLRHASVVQFLLGLCYGGFWATIAAMLMGSHGLGPAAAGLVAIPGAAGIFVARPAGRWMDRRGAHAVVATGAALIIAAFAVLAFGQRWLAAVVAGAALLDCGLRAAMVANQTLVTTADPEARSRRNTVFVACIWGGNAVGAFAASYALTYAGWPAVCGLALMASGLALVLQLNARPAPGEA